MMSLNNKKLKHFMQYYYPIPTYPPYFIFVYPFNQQQINDSNPISIENTLKTTKTTEINRDSWTKDEDLDLLNKVKLYGTRNWAQIARGIIT